MPHMPVPPTDADAPEEWQLSALEPVLLNLQTTVAVFGHLLNSPDEVDKNTWAKVEGDLIDAATVIQQLWHQAWDQGLAERRAHREALDAAKAEKAAPGSEADGKQVGALWELLAAAAAVAMRQCAEAGFRLPGWRQETEGGPPEAA